MRPKAEAHARIALAEKKLLLMRIDAAATYPIETELLEELIQDLSPEEIEALPYLPGRPGK